MLWISFTFLFLIASFLSLWIVKKPFVWGSFLGLSFFFGSIAGLVAPIGFVFLLVLLFLWIRYDQKPNQLLFFVLIAVSAFFKMKILPGYHPYFFTPKFGLGLEGSLIGLFPLAFLVPLARSKKDWIAVMKGTFLGSLGILVLALIAIVFGVAFQSKLPTFLSVRLLSNFFLTSIPEEGFYRGFIQKTLCEYLAKFYWGKGIALWITSVLFTLAHFYWSPNLLTLGFVFVASLLYGAVYLFSSKIESAILTHFLLNIVHMFLFSYHAM